MSKFKTLTEKYKHLNKEELLTLLQYYIEQNFEPNAKYAELKMHTDALYIALKLNDIDYGADVSVYHKFVS